MRKFGLLMFCMFFGMIPAQAQQVKKILVLGDSLSAGYNLPADQAFPVVLQAALKKLGHDISVINGGVSGDTSSGGLARLEWALGDGADAVIVELGANDMLRGINPLETQKALNEILSKLAQMKLPVLIAGMIAAPGMGKQYEDQFNGLYPALAARYGALIYPFFLDGVANERSLLLNDGMHPNKQGVDEMVRRIMPKVIELVDRMGK